MRCQVHHSINPYSINKKPNEDTLNKLFIILWSKSDLLNGQMAIGAGKFLKLRL